jgi:hypothetical protein
MLIRVLLITFLLCMAGFLSGQTPTDPDLLPYTTKDVSLKKRTTTDAEQLVKKLTQGKNGDQEKFDAIFTWVTTNIAYDYNEFYLPTAPIPGSIQRILKTKRTICLGYANLMDTLCMLAGIPNVTVYGYAKDEFFDVNDTIYTHNHAWSAVKIDGLWYLYDATWSKGKVEYELTPMAKWIIRWFDKHPEKLKKKKLRNKWRWKIKALCGEESGPTFYYKQRYFNRVLRHRMSLLPIHVKRIFKKGITKDFYLSEPRLFAITHLPDNPIWNLGDTRSFRELEKDSAWYHFTDSTLKSQTRQGVECPDCDRYAELNRKQQWQDMNARSRTFNTHNHFITTLCEDQIGLINWKQARVEKDSLSQMQFLDSAMTSFSNAYYSLRQSKSDFKSLVFMHKVKNKRKMSLLLGENKAHSLLMSKKVRLTLNQTRNYNILLSQGTAYAHTYLKKASRTKRFKINIKTDKLKPYPIQTLNAIQKDLAKKQQQLDTLSQAIRIKKQAFDSLILGVSMNIWQHVNFHDSISEPFSKSIKWRRRLKDNYKKVIVEIRKTIPAYEARYAESLENTVYKPSTEAFALFKHITVLIKAKTKLQNECLQYNRELLRAKTLSYEELSQYKEDIVKDCETDFCWVASNYPKLTTTWLGLKNLKHKQSGVLDLIAVENNLERHRYYELNRAVQHGYKEATKSLAFQTRNVKLSLKEIPRYRKRLIKKKK